MDIYCTLHLWDYNYNERHICDAILILNEVSKKAHVRVRRSQFDGSNSKWTNHTWASRMKLYCFVIKKFHSAWSKSFTWEWSIFEKPVENEIQWKTHSIFFWCTLRLIAKRLEQLDGFFDLFLQPFWSYWRWTFFCFIVEGYCHISNRHFLIF